MEILEYDAEGEKLDDTIFYCFRPEDWGKY